MKQKKIDFLFNNQKDLQKQITFEEIRNKIDVREKVTKNSFLSKRILIASIIIVLISVMGLSLHTINVEAKEYQKAVDFFCVNQLSIEGLTRAEIKKVYKDITTNTFKYDKTGKVIIESFNSKVPGYEITLENVTSKKISDLWNLMEKWNQDSIEEVTYEYDYHEIIYEDGRVEKDKTIFKKYFKGVEEWSIELYHLVEGYQELDDKLIVYGEQLYNHSKPQNTHISIISKDGKIIREYILKDVSLVYDIYENEDNSIDIFVNKTYDSSFLKMYQITNTGELIFKSENKFVNHKVETIAKLADGYLSYLIGDDCVTEFVKIDKNGSIQNEFYYEDNKYRYFFNDMIEYNGELYLSAYAVPYFEDYEYGRGEIKEILEIVWDSFPDITDEMVLRLFKERYKAIMLICDKEDGTLKEFYSVNSGIGSNFKVINGELVWEVESFETMHYSIATSAFTFIGETQVYNYIYNNETELKEIVQTEEFRVFRK